MKLPQSVSEIIGNVKMSNNNFQALKATLSSRLSVLRKDRQIQDRSSLEADFNNVLLKWGIHSPENIEKSIADLLIRLFVLAILPIMYGIFALFMQTVNSLIVLGILTVPCLFGIATTIWRIWILKNSRFVPFSRWLMHGLWL